MTTPDQNAIHTLDAIEYSANITPNATGNTSLRAARRMPILTAVRKDPWLRAHY